MQHASSTPARFNTKQHHKPHTVTNLCYVPSYNARSRHRGNIDKASKILGIHSNAVILANNKRKRKNDYNFSIKGKHRKSSSFSETLRNFKNIKSIKNRSKIGNVNEDDKEEEDEDEDEDDMKILDDDEDEDEEDEVEIYSDEDEEDEDRDEFEEEMMSDDEFGSQQLRFDKFQPQKRNTGRGHILRSQTVDLTNYPPKAMGDDLAPSSQQRRRDHHRHERVNTNSMTMSMSTNEETKARPRTKSKSKRRRESADVIEISFLIEHTKRGYLFLGVLPANKINNVVQPGFMFGFNEYSYSLHGYSGKLYHEKVASDYVFAPNNVNNKRMDRESAKGGTQKMTRSNTVDITAGISGGDSRLNLSATTMDMLSVHGAHNMENDRKENKDFINNFRENEEKSNLNQHQNQHDINGMNGQNKKLPVLQSGDIVTIKMKLNRNNGKFAAIYCINNVEYGVAWKAIDPPVTIGVTMVGRGEQISLLSCTYRPNKNDKSCVIL